MAKRGPKKNWWGKSQPRLPTGHFSSFSKEKHLKILEKEIERLKKVKCEVEL